VPEIHTDREHLKKKQLKDVTQRRGENTPRSALLVEEEL